MLIVPVTAEAWFAEKLREAYGVAKEADAKVKRHQDQAMIRQRKAKDLWEEYNEIKENKFEHDSWTTNMMEIDEFAKRDHTYNLDNLPNYVSIVWCYKDWMIVEPKSDQGWWCFLPWWWRHNIMLPPQSHINTRRKYYNDQQIINRLALINFESSFDENASNRYAHWYVQTLRSHGVAKDIDSQLKRMKEREERYTIGERYCWRYRNSDNNFDWHKQGADGVLSCLYRYHNHAHRTRYSKRGMEVTKYYRTLFNG